jgi:hypothetical protein
MSIIDTIFRPIYGKPCWQVEQGYSSFLTFDIGQPSLRITEPHEASDQAPESVRKNAARRFVYVRGEWHLWIYICDWRIFLNDQALANDGSNRRTIKKALVEINGQALTQVSVIDPLITVFEFDLGGKLEVIPNHKEYRKTVDLWLLYEPSGKVFCLRADGQYSHMPGNTPPEKHKWRPLRGLKPKVAVK